MNAVADLTTGFVYKDEAMVAETLGMSLADVRKACRSQEDSLLRGHLLRYADTLSDAELTAAPLGRNVFFVRWNTEKQRWVLYYPDGTVRRSGKFFAQENRLMEENNIDLHYKPPIVPKRLSRRGTRKVRKVKNLKTGEVYPSVTEAAKALGKTSGCITARCQRQRGMAYAD